LKPVRIEAFVDIGLGLSLFSERHAFFHAVYRVVAVDVKAPHDYLVGGKVETVLNLAPLALRHLTHVDRTDPNVVVDPVDRVFFSDNRRRVVLLAVSFAARHVGATNQHAGLSAACD
jgi:hypothetical protein